MVNAGFLKKIMVVGERNVLQQLTSFTDMAQTAALELKEMLRIEDDGKGERNEKIKNLEKKADEISMSIKQQITGGAISSNLMDNLITLVETCDDLLDRSYFISREIKRVHENAHKFDEATTGLLKDGYDVCRRILDVTSDALKQVEILLEATDARKIDDARGRIEKMEEEVDDMKDNLIDRLYANSDGIPYIVFIHLTELVHKLDDMLDDCEDISDLVHTIKVSITR